MARGNRAFFSRRNHLSMRVRSIAWLLALLTLTGCSNPRWSDSDYRPLGEPQAVQRK
jgi:hypothetical protein